MAIRSLLLSFAVTCFLGYSLTFGLTERNTFVKLLPPWTFLPIVVSCALAYLLAAWWACRGFREHKIIALASLGFCAIGVCVYTLGIAVQSGHGKPTKGQYDYDFTKMDPSERDIVAAVARDAGLETRDAIFTEHWHVAEAGGNGGKSFRLCLQKGHVTALNLSDHPVKDLAAISALPKLSDLCLRNCGLSDLGALHSGTLDRLDVSDNRITDLRTLAGCPTVGWLFARNNRLQSAAGLEQFKQLVSHDFSGNPLP